MTKIAHLSSVHQALDTRIFHKEAKSAAAAGYDVVFVVPAAQPYQDAGVRVQPVAVPAGRRERMTRTIWDIYRRAMREQADVYQFHDPELIPVGLLLKLHGKRVIYDVHEDRPQQMMTKYWVPAQLRPAMARAVRLAERTGGMVWDGVVTATPAIARLFPGERTVTVQNFPILDELISSESAPYDHRPPLAAYAGGLAVVRGAREMVRAIGMVKTPGATLALAGAYQPPALRDELEKLPGWDRVQERGWLGRSEVAALYAEARVGLVVLHPTGNYLEGQPVKLFEYMSAGLPVIASNFPHWRSLIAAEDSALLVDPLDPTAIAGAIDWIMAHPAEAAAMGDRGRRAVHDRFHWNAEAAQLLALYEDGLGLRPARRRRSPSV